MDANDITAGSADVGISVGGFDDDGAELTTDVADIDVSGEDLAVLNVNGPDAKDAVATGDEGGRGVVQEGQAERDVVGGGSTTERATSGEIPDNESVVILTAKGSEVLLISREGQGLYLDLVEQHAVNEFAGLPIEDADVGLESHVSDLTGGDVATGVADGEAADLIRVASEELSGTRVADLTDDDARAQSVKKVTAIGMHAKTTCDVTTETDGGF